MPSDLYETLVQEHRQAAEAFSGLEVRFEDGRAIDRDGLRRVISQDVFKHFCFEEKHLFPAIQSAVGADLVALLRAEHDAIKPLANALDDYLLCEEAVAVADRQRIHGLLAELVERSLFHIQKEEAAILPLIDTALDAETRSALLTAHQAHHCPKTPETLS